MGGRSQEEVSDKADYWRDRWEATLSCLFGPSTSSLDTLAHRCFRKGIDAPGAIGVEQTRRGRSGWGPCSAFRGKGSGRNGDEGRKRRVPGSRRECCK